MNNSKYGSHRGFKILKIAGMIAAGVAIAVLFALVFGLAVQYLWNWLMPDLFGFKAITYWQAFALVILAKIFFGSFAKHHGHDCNRGPWHGHMKRRLYDDMPRHDWKYFDRFWHDEGKNAFEEYVKKCESEKNE
jgi:hypothetical protein